MRFSSRQWRARLLTLMALASMALLVPSVARAQYSAPDMSGDGAIGEKYHVEGSASLWDPDLFGSISSEQFGLVGTKIDLVTDLGYVKTRFRDFKFVLRPTKKSKIRLQYTPIEYTAETSFKRDVVFNGIKFPLSVPIESTLAWKVLRLGYEYDFIYRSRGFVGMVLDARYTQMQAQLQTNSPIFSPAIKEFATAKAPLPAFGAVGRGYVTRQVAINFEITGFKLPNVSPKYQATYFDYDLNGTVNVTNNVGFQVGWRKVTNVLQVDKDLGDVQFQGLWFGAVGRF
jgi:hypothetical protein